MVKVSGHLQQLEGLEGSRRFRSHLLPGLGAHTLGEKLQEIAAKDELREKLGYSESV
jgi:hypothetical protein